MKASILFGLVLPAVSSLALAQASNCTPEHAAMGHCQLPKTAKPKAPTCTPEHAAMGHCKLPLSNKTAPTEPREPIPPISEQDRAAAFPTLRSGHQHASNRYWLARVDKLEGWHKGQAWEASFKYGGDLQHLLLQSEVQRESGKTESADLSAFYSRSISPWWDIRAGVRQQFQPSGRTFAAVAISGTPFYKLELAAKLYASASGQLQSKFTADYDLLLSNRLILQPSFEAKAALKNEPKRAIGSGLNSTESALRLRYEVTRQFAPYLGLVHEQVRGKSADFAKTQGQHRSDTRWVVGVKLWF